MNQDFKSPDSNKSFSRKIMKYLFQETASSVKHKILGGLSNMKDNSLQRVDDVSNALTDQLSDGIDAFGGGSKLEDCFLQVKQNLQLQ